MMLESYLLVLIAGLIIGYYKQVLIFAAVKVYQASEEYAG